MSEPVDQEMYMMVMGQNPSQTLCEGCSVEGVTFREALQFANRLSWAMGFDECYRLTRDEVIWLEHDVFGLAITKCPNGVSIHQRRFKPNNLQRTSPVLNPIMVIER